MNEQTPAASSPAEVADVFNGENLSVAEYDHYRRTEELPERFKKAVTVDAAATDDQEQTGSEANAESADESESSTEANQEQSRKPRNAAQRIAQLEAAIEAEWDKDEPDVVRIGQLNATIDKINGRPKRKTEVAPPQAAESTAQTVQQPQQYTSVPKPKADDVNPDGSPKWADWDSYNEALIDWKADEKIAKLRYEQAQMDQMRQLQTAVSDGTALYGKDFGPIADQTAGVIGTDPEIPQIVKARFAKSNVLPHLTYVIGEDPAALEDFVKVAKTDPFEALDRIAIIEREIREALAKPKETPVRGEDGKFTPKAPEPKKTTAPKPPSPVGGGSSRAFDVNDESLSPEEWFRKRNDEVKRKQG